MSRLEELIQTLCPDGVEFGELGDHANIDKGQQLNLTEMSNDEPYPVMNGGIYPSGYFNRFNTEENTITVSQGGASAGYVNFLKTKFWAGAHCYVVKPKSKRVINKFLYYLVKNSETRIQGAKYGAGIPGLNKSTLEQLSIPIPPLLVQEEIVRILDTFTALEAELEAELDARTKQYEYYRDALLNFDPENPHPLRPTRLNNLIQTLCPDGTEQKRLGELCVISNGRDHKPLADGDYPVYGTGGIMRGGDQYIYDKPSVLIPRKGSIENLFFVDEPFWVVDTIFYSRIDESIILPKYLFYLLKKEHLEELNEAGGVPSLTKSVLDLVVLNIPPLPVQEEIVAILDRFDTLVNDLKNGLPAEIAARRKQYEYYRDQLLTFKPLP